LKKYLSPHSGRWRWIDKLRALSAVGYQADLVPTFNAAIRATPGAGSVIDLNEPLSNTNLTSDGIQFGEARYPVCIKAMTEGITHTLGCAASNRDRERSKQSTTATRRRQRQRIRAGRQPTSPPLAFEIRNTLYQGQSGPSDPALDDLEPGGDRDWRTNRS
jgi:hypothetical protein